MSTPPLPSITPVSTASTLKPLFHAGGHLTPRGHIGSTPGHKGKRFSHLQVVEKLARLDVGAGSTGLQIPDVDISKMIGRSVYYIKTLRRKAEYLRFRIALQTGISMDSEKTFSEIASYRKAYFKEMLPDALRVIADELNRPAFTLADRKLKVDLAKDLMDREGTFPKISRTDSHLKIEHDYTQADNTAQELLALMDSNIQESELTAETQRILNANSSFSNSQTISHDKQESALKTLELENLDLSSKEIQ